MGPKLREHSKNSGYAGISKCNASGFPVPVPAGTEPGAPEVPGAVGCVPSALRVPRPCVGIEGLWFSTHGVGTRGVMHAKMRLRVTPPTLCAHEIGSSVLCDMPDLTPAMFYQAPFTCTVRAHFMGHVHARTARVAALHAHG